MVGLNLRKVRKAMMTLVWLLLMGLALYFIVWLSAYYWLAERLMFFPPALQATPHVNTFYLTHANGERIEAMWFGERQGKGKVLLYQHGNAELLQESMGRLQALSVIMQLPVLAYEYRGYGSSDGKATIKGMREDGELAWRYLQQQGYQASEVVVYGRSLGSSNATYLSMVNDPVAGLILEVPMWDAFRVYADLFWTWRSHLENGRRIEHITAPTLILYAENDQLIRPWHSKQLLKASAADYKQRIGFAVGHADVPNDKHYPDTLRNFWHAL